MRHLRTRKGKWVDVRHQIGAALNELNLPRSQQNKYTGNSFLIRCCHVLYTIRVGREISTFQDTASGYSVKQPTAFQPSPGSRQLTDPSHPHGVPASVHPITSGTNWNASSKQTRVCPNNHLRCEPCYQKRV